MEQTDERDLKITHLEKNNFRLKIIVGVMFLVCLLLSMYSFVQQGIAGEYHRMAYEAEIKARQNAVEANRQRDQALRAIQEAQLQREELQKALAESIWQRQLREQKTLK